MFLFFSLRFAQVSGRLDPCGHTFDLACLQEWFRTPPIFDEDTEMTRPTMAYCPVDQDKTCPSCRTIVDLPFPCYSLKSVVHLLNPTGVGGPLADEEEPWLDIFYEDRRARMYL
ncbi:hypothetical protein C8R43DRAFT_1020916 [Mycena crocata]|nr:hypothetical protein C8R43DRAFT_1020916 [Mycena crocata]